MEQNLKISEHAEMGKGTVEHDGLKNPQNCFKNLGKKFWVCPICDVLDPPLAPRNG